MSKSMTGVWLTAGTALGAVLLLVLAIGAAEPANATHQPLSLVAIDTNTSGNSATTVGTVDECVAIGAGESVDVDVIVQTIPAESGGEHGLGAFGLDIVYDPAILEVTAKTVGTTSIISSNPGGYTPFSFTDSVPDTDGDFQVSETDLSTNYDSGAGVLIRVTFHAVGTGIATLDLTDVVGGDGTPNIGDAGAFPYNITTVADGRIAVGSTCGAGPSITPSPTPEPGETTPAGTTPAGTTPAGTTPAGTTPAGTTPAGTTPAGTTPAVTTPAATTPAATTPGGSSPTPTPTPTTTPTATPIGGSATATATAAPTCNTTLAASANVGATSITVTSAAGCGVGDTLRLGSGAAQEDVKIASISGTTITLVAALTKNHPAGETVTEVASATSSPSVTPKTVPNTGGSDGGLADSSMLLLLALGGALLVSAAGSAIAFKASRRE